MHLQERRGLLLVEGTFTASLPAFDVIRAQLPHIGPIEHVELHKKIRTSISHHNPILNSRETGGGVFDGCGSYSTHALCEIFGAEAVAALRPSDVQVASTASPSGAVDWSTTATLRMRGGAVAVLTHRAADDARPSVVHGAHGSIEFTLPYLNSVTVRRVGDSAADAPVTHNTSYGGLEPLTDLDEGEPSAPHGIHPGLGVQAAAVQREVLAGTSGPGTPYLTAEVMRAMAHAMDLIRHRIPTHLHLRAP